MKVNKSTVVLTKRDHYAADFSLVLRQVRESFNSKQVTTLQVRRVVPTSGEELQIEIEICDIGKRNVSKHCSFICTPEIADMLAKACKEVRE